MTLIERFKAETPIIWKHVIWLASGILGWSTLILGYDKVEPLPPNIISIAGYAFTIATGVIVFAKGQAKKPEDKC